MTRADAARAALRHLGRRVSVRSRDHSVPIVTIRDATIPISAVRSMLSGIEPEKCSTDDGHAWTVPGAEVCYSPDIVGALADVIETRLRSAPVGEIVEVAPVVFLAHDGLQSWAEKVTRWPWDRETCQRLGPIGYCVGIRHAATRIAEELLDRGESARSVASWSPAPSDDWIDRLDL